MSRILLLEDDRLLQEILVECLIEEGYEVVACECANEALSKSYEEHFDVLLLDVMVQNGNGFEVLKEIRERGEQTPAIFITALNQIKDLEIGFKSGCDDYLKKPFELKELLLRLGAILKRQYKEERVDFGNGYEFDCHEGTLYYLKKPHKFSSKERELLKLLLQNQNSFVSLEKIYQNLWGFDEEPSELSLRVYIKNLRKIVGKDHILTRRGEGYCYYA
ncbi:two-component system response regulator [Helicobacter valdiviensis]|uniref:Two-component system response regulator n=1 Tax=Helicobacter valdiviensis TaxID=1458358 RepID=A0A2W6NKJ5_9HELI|nr:response regulator transcription factor [Helicobacter valdiviensis]PZT47936.1 two-component system response regulator [Helicobacter valdiviensis]